MICQDVEEEKSVFSFFEQEFGTAALPEAGRRSIVCRGHFNKSLPGTGGAARHPETVEIYF